jgi:hypothetical protein
MLSHAGEDRIGVLVWYEADVDAGVRHGRRDRHEALGREAGPESGDVARRFEDGGPFRRASAPAGHESADLKCVEEHVREPVREGVDAAELLSRYRHDIVEPSLERRPSVRVEERCNRLAHPNGCIRQQRREAGTLRG